MSAYDKKILYKILDPESDLDHHQKVTLCHCPHFLTILHRKKPRSKQIHTSHVLQNLLGSSNSTGKTKPKEWLTRKYLPKKKTLVCPELSNLFSIQSAMGLFHCESWTQITISFLLRQKQKALRLFVLNKWKLKGFKQIHLIISLSNN